VKFQTLFWNIKNKIQIIAKFLEITWSFEKLQPQSGNFMNDPRTCVGALRWIADRHLIAGTLPCIFSH